MGAEANGNIFTERFEQLKQKQSYQILSPQQVLKIEPQSIIVRPADPTWEQLERELAVVTIIPKPLIWITIKKYYEQGYGAHLLTVAEIALAIHKKQNPSHLFIKMISQSSGNWERTLKKVKETWEVRRNALEVMNRLNLEAKSAKAILKLAWRLKGTIIRYLGIATERGKGVRSPAGLFFALTRKPTLPAT